MERVHTRQAYDVQLRAQMVRQRSQTEYRADSTTVRALLVQSRVASGPMGQSAAGAGWATGAEA